MKEIAIISGKGGTGKTSITAAFADLSEHIVLADCDVDASNMHLVMSYEQIEKHPFIGGKKAVIANDFCIGCEMCIGLCRFDAITSNYSPDDGALSFSIDPISCEGCGVCVWNCPTGAILFQEVQSGEWYRSKIKNGYFIHARLFAAEENSGKLVSQVRKEAKSVAQEHKIDTILIDGPPGIACPVIASITGTQTALIVVEPSLSGLHDLIRVHELINHFRIAGAILINKWDTNPELTTKIENKAMDLKLPVLGKIPYDSIFHKAQMNRQSIVGLGNTNLTEELKNIWLKLQNIMVEAR